MQTQHGSDVNRQYIGHTILKTERLSQDTFSAFGSVIEPPQPAILPSTRLRKEDLPPSVDISNQGTALVYPNVTQIENLYSRAPSGHSETSLMRMYICAPRTLLEANNASLDGYFPLEVLERHPYTSQTFIPLGLSAAEQDEARYIVIVAPSLPENLTNDSSSMSTSKLSGHYQPDMEGIQAFVANGSQAVTYKAGTWHAPMVVVGKKGISFVVRQYANQVAEEDGQEVDIIRHRLLAEVPLAQV